MAFQNAIIQGLQAQGEATSYYFEASRDVRVNADNPPSGLTYVTSFQLRDNFIDNYASDTWLLGNSQWGIKLLPQSYWYFQFWLNGSAIAEIGVIKDTTTEYPVGNFQHVSLFFGIDETNQRGTIFILRKSYQTYSTSSYYWHAFYDTRLINSASGYNWISGHIQPQYTWQSVPSISGKNGISQPLSSHLDINNGEPITTSDTTKYSLSNNSNINKLVQDKLNS